MLKAYGPERTFSSRASCSAAVPRAQQHDISTTHRQYQRIIAVQAVTDHWTVSAALQFNELSSTVEQTVKKQSTEALHAILRSLQSFNRNVGRYYFEGVGAPVGQEVLAEDLEVEGSVPPAISGAYIRTGPNPQHEPHGGYIMVDGEAMLHAVRFDEGRALSYSNHWLRCRRFTDEQDAGENIYLRIGDIRGIPGVAIMVLTQLCPWMFPEPEEYLNYQLGNTSLAVHHGRLLALMEGGKPFEATLDTSSGALASVGPYDFGGRLPEATSGHPKVCPVTGEMLSFHYRVMPRAEGEELCVFHVVSPDGALSRDYPVAVSRGQMMHDFAITERWAVFCDSAVVFDPVSMVVENGMPFAMDRSRASRIGLLSREDPSAPMRWFEVAPFAFFHTANAWEDGDKVHLVLCRFNEMNLSRGLSEGFGDDIPEVHRFTLDLETGEVEETCLVPGRAADFPTVPKELVGRPHRFCYAAVASRVSEHQENMSTTSIVKVDMTAEAGQGLAHGPHEIVFGPGEGETVIGGEATFVARDSDALLRGECAEDDGYLIVYTTDSNTMTSYCVIYDAQTMDNKPLAKVTMPQRVPVGLHGTFIPSAVLESLQGQPRRQREQSSGTPAASTPKALV